MFEHCCQGLEEFDLRVAVLARANWTRTETANYWERRYSSGGMSNTQDVVDQHVFPTLYKWRSVWLRHIFKHATAEGRPLSVLDLGVGDGRQAFNILCGGQVESLTGLDVSWFTVHALENRLNSDRPLGCADMDVYWYDGFILPQEIHGLTFDVTLSLQVVFHLLEDALFERYMALLFMLAREVVVVHAPDIDDALPQIAHMRYRRFSSWVATWRPDWELKLRVPVPMEVGTHSDDALHVYGRLGS